MQKHVTSGNNTDIKIFSGDWATIKQIKKSAQRKSRVQTSFNEETA
jgi:hypothetical protein